MLVDVAHDHQLVHAGLGNERVQSGTDGLRGSHYCPRKHTYRLRLLVRRPVGLDVVDRRLAEPTAPAEDVGKRHLLRRREARRLRIDFRGDHVDASHRVGPIELRGWLGSIMLPAPTRIVVVPAAMCAITIEVAALAMPAML